MVAAIIRCLAGYTLACVAAGIVQVAFVLSPLDLLTADPDRLTAAGIWLRLASEHTAVFAAPFALVALVVAEWKGLNCLAYYEAVGFAIAVLGFLTQTPARPSDQPIVVTLYVLAACLTSGLSAGLVYWAISGRRAGRFRRHTRI